MKHALIVFAKVPVPGRVKTRLMPALSAEQAARLYEAFLKDALAQYVALDADVRRYFSPSAESIPPAFLPKNGQVFAQQGEGLGARMLNAFAETFAAGYEAAVVIGTDHPTLPTVFLEEAFAALAAPLSVCLGPSDDGGYYLLGMNDLFPQLFEGMTYSHPLVFEETLARAGSTGAHLTILPPWYDVDTPETLERLRDELAEASIEAPRTRAVLQEMMQGAGPA